MVLAELGNALKASLQRLNASTVVSEDVVNAILKDISRALIEADVNIKLVSAMQSKIKARFQSEKDGVRGSDKRKLVQKYVQEELVALLRPTAVPYVMSRKRSNVVMFVGLQGAGKTTSIAKYAAYYVRKGWKVAMVCCDSFRAGAFDQLKQNATKLRVPFYGSYTLADPVDIATKGVKQFKADKYDIILIDTSGRHRQEASLFEEMQELTAAVEPDDVVFVMDGTQGQAVFDQAKAFRDAVPVGSVIVTKLDGHAKGGGAISAVAATDSPITFLGSGEHFDAFEPFDARNFVAKLLGYGDVRWKEALKELQGDKASVEAMKKKLKNGDAFTLRDMYEHIGKLAKLGGMGKILEMMPGMANLAPLMGGGAGGAEKMFKKFTFVMDSMKDDELDGIVDFATCPDRTKRVRRIAAGSGCHPSDVEMLFKMHKMFGMQHKQQAMAANPQKGAMSMQQMQALAKQNPAALMKQINSGMDPKQLKQLGGAENVVKMIKSGQMPGGGDDGPMPGGFPGMGGMPGGGGMPDFTQMAKMFGGGGMPDMAQMAQMFGGGGGLGGGGGGMPDMAQMAQMEAMMKQMGMK